VFGEECDEPDITGGGEVEVLVPFRELEDDPGFNAEKELLALLEGDLLRL